MSISFYIRLTLAVHKVLELFPEGESLKLQIRETAEQILIDLINNDSEKCSLNIERLKELFDAVEAKAWVDGRNFLVLCREYDKIREFCVENMGKTGEKPRKTQKRKEVILEKLKKNGKVKIGDLLKIFPGANRRTLLRDLEDFSQTGLIVKNGNGRGACYTLKNATL